MIEMCMAPLVNGSDGKTCVLKENSVPVLFGAPQIPHGLVSDRARPATALRLGTAWSISHTVGAYMRIETAMLVTLYTYWHADCSPINHACYCTDHPHFPQRYLNRVKEKLSLSTAWQHIRGAEVQLHWYLTFELQGREWLGSRPGRFNRGEGFRVGLDV